jgi:transposase
VARPRIEIDKKAFENLCALQCTLVEISAFFECSEDTIERWCKREYKEGFAETYKKKSAKGKMSLRRSQFKLAETNTSMAIWLGKQILGQKDHEFIGAMEPIEIVNDIGKKDDDKNKQ